MLHVQQGSHQLQILLKALEGRSKEKGREKERERVGEGRKGEMGMGMGWKKGGTEGESEEREEGRERESIGREDLGRKKKIKRKCLTSLVVLSSHNLCHQYHLELLPPDASF